MSVAYIVSAYKYPQQLARLLRRLQAPGVSFFVHVDKRTEGHVYEEMLQGVRDVERLVFVKRHACHWGGFGHVAASLQGISELFESHTAFDYAVLLTGQDYPITSNEMIDRYFREHRGRLFMEYFPLPTEAWENGGLDRIESWHLFILGRHFRFPVSRRSRIKRRFPSGFRPYGGSSYWCLPDSSVEYVYRFVQDHKSFVNFFRHVDVPDELFFQTILLNSPFADAVVNDNLRYIDWKDPDGPSPSILGKDDLGAMMRSGKLFARKFDITVDADVLDMIDRLVADRASEAAWGRVSSRDGS